MSHRCHFAFLFIIGALMLLAAGCEDTGPSPEERVAIDTAVRGYLHALAEAYSAGSYRLLIDFALAKRALTGALARARGERS